MLKLASLASALFRDVVILIVPGAAIRGSLVATARVSAHAGSIVAGSLTDAALPSFVISSSSWQSAVPLAGANGWLQ
ncbi:hypothetical protein BSY238_3078 [Methyloversatilis sp. RAC08]|uniref:hypothetical protein n=1 Tax=Methyloversatilis sp. RAC08 TaxID=1842540 RepID=UPI00083D8916|nr:hypothetical protein [Methyloversatilis sp. RAC08]AOF83164.1 hypothetical protein BSY238_3078 [Methyloversatilis sp. RAC08]